MDSYDTLVLIFILSIASIKGIASQPVLNITPFPTATVTENDSTTLTCTYSDSGICPSKQILFTWNLNDAKELALGWTGTTCTNLGPNTTLEFSCRSVQTTCEMLLTLKQVRNSQHGDKWKCVTSTATSGETTIVVNVPITAVQLTSPATSPVSVVENVPYNFVCQTSAGRPQATVEWYKRSGSGAEVAIPGGSTSTELSGTLIITRSTLGYRATKADEGNRIYCKASNVGPVVISSQQPVMSILYIPVIQPIQDRDVILSSALIVQCDTTAGNPPQTSYRWTWSGSSSWSQDGQTLSIPSVEKTDAGHYRCTAWNVMTQTGGTQVKGELTTTFTLNVLYVPVIQAIQDRDVEQASTLTVPCVTTPGNPAHTSYRWTRSGGGSWSQTGQTLNISRVEKTDAGDYTCTAWNVMIPTEGMQVTGTVSTTFTLNVLYAPVIHPIQDRDILLASPLTVHCDTTPGNPTQTSYRWTRSGDSSWSQTGQTLSLSRVEKTDAGDYTCTAWNVMTPTAGTQVKGEVSTTFTLNVLYKASVTSFKIAEETGGGPYIVDENSRRTFRCEVDSNPTSEIQIIRAHGTVLAYNTNTLSVMYSTTLGCHDSGKYECKGSNTYTGEVKPTAELELFVRCHPRAAELNITVYKALHESVTLNSSVTAYPQPTYTWFKAADNGGWTGPTSEKTAYLTIEDLREDDFRQYKVEVTNRILPDLVLYYVIEASRKPEPPFNFTVLSEHITQSSAIVQWYPGFNGGLPQVFYVEYKKKEVQTWTEIAAVAETAINKTITSLVPNTAFVVRMYAMNRVGKSNTTETLEFKTLTPVSLKTRSTPLGGIIGGTVAGLVVVVLIAATVFVLRRRRDNSKHSTKGKTASDSKELQGLDHQYDNIASSNELVDSQQNSSRYAYETLQRPSDDPRVYDDLHQTQASIPESNDYERLQHGGKNADGVYDELDSKVDNQINDESKVYVNMEI